MPDSSSPRSARGFTLLEAIIAMVVMATSLLALYSWLSSSTFALNRVQAQSRALDDARAGLALIETINPMLEPSGERSLPPLTIRWHSAPVSERTTGQSRIGMATQFDFRLYEVTVEILRENRNVREFSVRKAGWEVARPINPDDL